ncbi:MAG: uracil-DNA glycosylase [Candidatus Dojkabacteria bacterium]|nr:uracil-DNA glycosylase [Candidatus Dojkabacteria bacterium]
MNNVRIEESWKILLQDEFNKEYFVNLTNIVRNAYISSINKVAPAPKNIFRAFNLVPLYNLKVIIIGQDPYHTPNVADGLAFSSFPTNPIPPSLRNIFSEIEADLNIQTISNPDLTRWAVQGVLLLNTVLTVLIGKPGSHKNIGWEIFTDAVIKKISTNCSNLVFMLWGNFAIKKLALIDTTKHLVLTAAHPSPFSANKGFFGCKHFSKANDFLIRNNISAIDWR